MAEEQTKTELSKQDRINNILKDIKDPKERAEKEAVLNTISSLWQEPDKVQGVTEQEKTPLTGK